VMSTSQDWNIALCFLCNYIKTCHFSNFITDTNNQSQQMSANEELGFMWKFFYNFVLVKEFCWRFRF
jgi:hypothetical protein